MVKKKEDVVVVRKKSLSYKDIVDDMSDESFNFCVSLLYPLLGYQVMGQDEVRRVDLKEKLLELEGQIPSAKNAKYPGILNYYRNCLGPTYFC